MAKSTATIALVAGIPEDEMHRDWTQYDLGQTTTMMMLAATDLGIGTAHAATTDQDQARAVLGLPEDTFLAYVLSLGYPKGRELKPIEHPDRRPFDEVVHRGRW